MPNVLNMSTAAWASCFSCTGAAASSCTTVNGSSIWNQLSTMGSFSPGLGSSSCSCSFLDDLAYSFLNPAQGQPSQETFACSCAAPQTLTLQLAAAAFGVQAVVPLAQGNVTYVYAAITSHLSTQASC